MFEKKIIIMKYVCIHHVLYRDGFFLLCPSYAITVTLLGVEENVCQLLFSFVGKQVKHEHELTFTESG